VIAVCLLALAGAVIAWLGRGWFFFHDEWGLIFYRRQGGLDTFLAPIHGHLFAGVIAIYRVLFATVGLRHYGAYRGVEIALHLTCAALLYLYVRRRGLHPVLSLSVLALFLFLGSTYEVVFWLASAGFVIPMIAMLAILLVWDTGVRGSNAITAVLASVALGSYGLGVAVVVGLGVCALGPGRSLRRLAALGIPLAAWVIWFVTLRPHLLPSAALRQIPAASPTGDVGKLGLHGSHISQLPTWVIHAAVGALAGFSGQTSWVGVGVALALAGAALLGWAHKRRALDWRATGLGVAMLSFWVLTGVARVQKSSPSASRYVYPAAVLLLLLLAECVRDVKPRIPVLAIVTAAVALALCVNIDQLHVQGTTMAASSAREKAVLAQLESCRGKLFPFAVPDPKLGLGVTAGPYWAATAALGNPVPPAPPDRDALCPTPSP